MKCKAGYSPTTNMRFKLHVLECLFLRGCIWKSPARYFRRPYQFSCTWYVRVDVVVYCNEIMPMMWGTKKQNYKVPCICDV